MARILHDLTASQDRRFSPYCWRTKLALAHKGLAYETRPVRFTEIEGLSDGPRLTLPTLDDGETRIVDSWAIAEYLEATYPHAPTLFPDGQGLARFINAWTGTLHPPILRLILLDVHDTLDVADQAYFRSSREDRFGVTLEAFVAQPEKNLEAFRAALTPLRECLKAQPFLSGEAPAYADYIPASAFLWSEAISDCQLLAADDPLAAWLDRIRPASLTPAH